MAKVSNARGMPGGGGHVETSIWPIHNYYPGQRWTAISVNHHRNKAPGVSNKIEPLACGAAAGGGRRAAEWELSRVKLTNAHTVRGRPTLSVFKNGLVRERQRKLSRHSKTMVLIDAMTNRNVRSVRVKSMRVWTEECVTSLRVAGFV